MPRVASEPWYAIDPGAHKCGFASVTGGKVVLLATLTRDALLNLPMPAYWVCETPQSYGHISVAHKDLDDLRLTLKLLEAKWGKPKRRYLPSEWKGNVPKTVHHNRIRPLLVATELDWFDRVDHNARDACALALFRLGRVGKGGSRV